MAMPYSCVFHLMICFSSLLVTGLVISSSIVNASGEHHHHNQEFSWMPTRPACQGWGAECMANDDGEFDMDSEINQRILAISKHISYEALKPNTIPCSVRGASYYNCQPGAEANPYTRGCSAIARCRK